MYSRAITALRLHLQLTPTQEELLVGFLLGDGYLFPTVSGKYAYLRMAHGPKQEGYLRWKYQLFRDWVLSPPRFQLQNSKKPELGGYYWFKTIAHSSFLTFRQLFYVERKKRVPKKIGRLLRSPRSLAVWYGDDGTLTRHGLRIQSEGFPVEDNQRLLAVLSQNFGVNGILHRNGGNGYGWSITLKRNAARDFFALIRPYLPSSMKYKMFFAP